MKPVNVLLVMAACVAGLAPVARAQAGQEQTPIPDLMAPAIKPAFEPSKLDQLLLEKDALITQGFSDVGTLRGDNGASVRVRAVQFGDGSAPLLYGVLVQIDMQTGRTAQSYVDRDKLDGLIKSIDTLRTMDHGSTEMADFQGSYRTAGGLEVRNTSHAGIRVGEIRCVQIRYDTGSVTWAQAVMPVSQLDAFKRLLAVAKDKITEAEKARPAKS